MKKVDLNSNTNFTNFISDVTLSSCRTFEPIIFIRYKLLIEYLNYNILAYMQNEVPIKMFFQ